MAYETYGHDLSGTASGAHHVPEEAPRFAAVAALAVVLFSTTILQLGLGLTIGLTVAASGALTLLTAKNAHCEDLKAPITSRAEEVLQFGLAGLLLWMAKGVCDLVVLGGDAGLALQVVVVLLAFAALLVIEVALSAAALSIALVGRNGALGVPVAIALTLKNRFFGALGRAI